MKKILHRLLLIQQGILNKIEKEELLLLAAVAGIYMIMGVMGITCPILFITGISCAGCGMSRAWLSLFRLDFSAALHYHPLFFFPALMVFIFLFKRKFVKKCCLVGAVLFLAVYGIRMASGQNEVVVFRPAEGFLYRSIASVFQRI